MKRRPLAQSDIANEDTGTSLFGHYDTQLTTFDCYGGSFVRASRVEDFTRERGAVDLVMFALETLHPIARSMTMGTPTAEAKPNN
jgi:hypothetical protein